MNTPVIHKLMHYQLNSVVEKGQTETTFNSQYHMWINQIGINVRGYLNGWDSFSQSDQRDLSGNFLIALGNIPLGTPLSILTSLQTERHEDEDHPGEFYTATVLGLRLPAPLQIPANDLLTAKLAKSGPFDMNIMLLGVARIPTP